MEHTLNLEKHKLTNYQKAVVWAEIDREAKNILNSKQNSTELYKAVDNLIALQKKLKWHEVAMKLGEPSVPIT